MAAHTTAAIGDSPFRFLDLPQEIQDEIVGHYYGIRPVDLSVDFEDGDWQKNDKYIIHLQTQDNAILLVNRHISQTAKNVRQHAPVRLRTLKSIEGTFCKIHAMHLRHGNYQELLDKIVQVDMTHDYCCYDDKWTDIVTFLHFLLDACPALRELHITFQSSEEHIPKVWRRVCASELEEIVSKGIGFVCAYKIDERKQWSFQFTGEAEQRVRLRKTLFDKLERFELTNVPIFVSPGMLDPTQAKHDPKRGQPNEEARTDNLPT